MVILQCIRFSFGNIVQFHFVHLFKMYNLTAEMNRAVLSMFLGVKSEVPNNENDNLLLIL